MLHLSDINVDDIATALSDQTNFEHAWLIDPRTGTIAIWTEESGIDGSPVKLDELDLLVIEPSPPRLWYRDMVDFTFQVSDEALRARLERALEGRGAFRRFRDVLYDDAPHLVSVWQTFRDTRARRRAVDWLIDRSLIEAAEGQSYKESHCDPPVP